MQIIKEFLTQDAIIMIRMLASSGHGWEYGRQGTGYDKMDVRDGGHVLEPLIEKSLKALKCSRDDNMWDCYLIRYPDGAHIPPHVDECTVFRHRHVRINALATKPTAGGVLTIADKQVDLDVGDAVLFYPDEEVHSVTSVVGPRLLWSVGCFLRGDE